MMKMKLVYVGERQCHLTKDLASQCNEMVLMLLLRSQTGVNVSFFGPIWGEKKLCTDHIYGTILPICWSLSRKNESSYSLRQEDICSPLEHFIEE